MKWTIQEGANSYIFDCRIFCEEIDDVIAFCDNDNAALICAAPELLEVLEMILEEDSARLKNDTWRKLREVIAKAKQITK